MLLGAGLLSTGGGGSAPAARKLINRIKPAPRLIRLADLKPDDLIVTLLGVGDKDVCDPINCSLQAIAVYQKIFKQLIKAIIPVEIGPLSTLTAVFLAAKLKLPIVDADIVGNRASPEVFIETITLTNLAREPIAIVNDKKDILILYRSASVESMEKTLRDFAVTSGGDAYGVGYPLTAKQLKNVAGNGSVSGAITLGQDLIKLQQKQIDLNRFCRNNSLVILGKTKIAQANLKIKGGFIQGQYRLGNNQTILVKNENIAFIKNSRSVLTVPDSIMLLDQKKLTGINNQDKNTGKEVVVLGKKAIPIWRTKAGIKLFSPAKLGYNIKQKLL